MDATQRPQPDCPEILIPAETNCEVVEHHHYCPSGVQEVLASGTSAFIGLIDDSTILKYPLAPDSDMGRLEVEHQILTLVGPHPRIIAHKGLTDAGLYLERAANGTVYWYLTESEHSPPTIQQRVAWCREVTEAVEHVHSKGVIHCDIQPTNVLVDGNLHLKLSDFQGNVVSEDGNTVLSGGSGEPCRYFCPRLDDFHADTKTDLFALGSTIFFIMTGYEVFPDIIAGQDGWHEKVRCRFERDMFPVDPHVCDVITRKCWQRGYKSASEVPSDMRNLERELS